MCLLKHRCRLSHALILMSDLSLLLQHASIALWHSNKVPSHFFLFADYHCFSEDKRKAPISHTKLYYYLTGDSITSHTVSCVFLSSFIAGVNLFASCSLELLLLYSVTSSLLFPFHLVHPHSGQAYYILHTQLNLFCPSIPSKISSHVP